jgi:Ion transport protein
MNSKVYSGGPSLMNSKTKLIDVTKLQINTVLINGSDLRLGTRSPMAKSPSSSKSSRSKVQSLRISYLSFQYSIQNAFLKVCMSRVFALVILVLITVNTIILAMDSYPINQERDETLDLINTFLTWCFFTEMLIKIIGLGVTHYIRDKVNIFDAIIVMLTVADSITDIVMTSTGNVQNGTVSGFRAVRLFRFFKVARAMKSFQIMIEKIAISLNDIISFSILLFLFLFTFTLLGLELFSNQVKFDEIGNVDLVNGTSPRPNFDDFIQGFVAIFCIMIGDNWP